jgi:hypothetical protein
MNKLLALLFFLLFALVPNVVGMDVNGTWKIWDIYGGERSFEQEIEISQSGNSLICQYANLMEIVGTISGNSFRGVFRNHTGDGQTLGFIEMTFSSDGTSFTGRWKNVEQDPWTPWEGKKIAGSSNIGNAVDQRDNDSGTYESPTGTANEVMAFITKIEGPERVWIDGLPIKLGVKNIPVFEGARVSTGAGTRVVLTYKTTAFVILEPKTDFAVRTEKMANADMLVIYKNLLEGIAHFYFSPNAEAKEKFEVETEMAIVGIRGTIFNVEHSSDKTIVEVSEGTVTVKSKATGKEVTVNAGEKITVTASGLSEIGAFNAQADISRWNEIISGDSAKKSDALGDTEQIGTDRAVFSASKIDNQHQAFNRNDPNASQIYYYNQTEGGQYWVFAGAYGRVEDSTYSRLWDPVFSKDGKHIAYKAMKGDKLVAVVDRVEGPEYDDIYNNIVLSSDGERFTYLAKKGDQMVAVIDGREEGSYEGFSGDPIISSGGQHVLYTISKDNINYVVVDGKIQEHMGSSPVVSPDGSRWAYGRSATFVGDPCYIVLDGEVIDLGKDNSVRQMVFSSDGKRFVYDLVPGDGAYGNHVVTVDGVRGKEYPFPGVGNIVFSPDGSRVAYWAKAQGEGFMMVLDGEENEIYDKVQDPIFSPNGKHLAYVAEDDGKKFMVLDGKEGARYYDVWNPVFSSNGRLGYAARINNSPNMQSVVVDGKEGRAYLKDGTEQGILSGPAFSPDGKHVVYMANDGAKAEFLVVDEHMQMSPWLRLYESPLVFDSSDEFHYLSFNSSGTYQVVCKITPLSQPNDCSWTGIWESDFGFMGLEQFGDQISGVYRGVYSEWGQIAGLLEGENLTGTWSQFPNRKGGFEFVMDKSCNNFTGNWSEGTREEWSGKRNGKRYS